MPRRLGIAGIVRSRTTESGNRLGSQIATLESQGAADSQAGGVMDPLDDDASVLARFDRVN